MLDNVFIPDHYAVPMIEAQLGTVVGVDIPLYRLPIRPALATMLLGTIVGMAERGLQIFVDRPVSRPAHRWRWVGSASSKRRGFGFSWL